MKRRPKEIPVSSFMHRVRKANRDDDVEELRTAVESALAGICAFNLSVDARWVVEALAVMRQEWRGQPRWKWLYESWSDFLDVLQIDSELEAWFDQIVSAKPDATLGEVIEQAKKLRAKPGAPEGNQNAKKVKAENNGSNTTIDRGVGYTLARLDRDNPDLAAEVRAGRKSANAAAIEAGFRKKPSPLTTLTRAWAKASDDERQAFLAHIRNP